MLTNRIRSECEELSFENSHRRFFIDYNSRRFCKYCNFPLIVFQSSRFSELSGSVIPNAPASCGQKLSFPGRTLVWKKAGMEVPA
jgi:hypothetical protein